MLAPVEFVAGLGASAWLEPRRLLRAGLAVEAAAVNVSRRACSDGGGESRLRLAVAPLVVTVKIEDPGVGFDPLSVARRDLKAGVEERNVGGLGGHLVRQQIDEASHRREGWWSAPTPLLKTTR